MENHIELLIGILKKINNTLEGIDNRLIDIDSSISALGLNGADTNKGALELVAEEISKLNNN